MKIVIKAATKEGVYATMLRQDSISNRAELLEIALETMGTCTITRHTSKGNFGVIHTWDVLVTSAKEAEHFVGIFEE